MSVDVLFEDNNILIAVKPPQIPSQPDKTGDPDMTSLLMEQCGAAYMGCVHRLDRPVGGVMVFAKNKETEKRLFRMIQEEKFSKQYFAVVCGIPREKSAELRDFLLKIQKSNLSQIVSEQTKGAKEAILKYQHIETVEEEEWGSLSLLHIDLRTGRHHQIRVQLAGIDLPIWGDNKYNPIFQKRRGWHQIALWAGTLVFPHPFTGKKIIAEALPKEYPFSLFSSFKK